MFGIEELFLEHYNGYRIGKWKLTIAYGDPNSFEDPTIVHIEHEDCEPNIEGARPQTPSLESAFDYMRIYEHEAKQSDGDRRTALVIIDIHEQLLADVSNYRFMVALDETSENEG